MTKKIKDVYAWVEEQEEYWDNLTSKKLKQLDDITNSHLDWFNKHTTISDILSWKKPVVELNTPDKQETQIDSKSSRSFNNDITLNQPQPTDCSPSERLHDNKEEITEIHIAPEFRNVLKAIPDASTQNPLDYEEESTNLHIAPEFRDILETTVTTAADSLSMTESENDNVESSSQNDISIHEPITPELDTQSNTQSQNVPSTPKALGDEEVISSLPVSPKHHHQPEIDDDEDEIQLFVPKHHYQPDSNKFTVSPVRASVTQSPIRTASIHYTSPNRNLTQPPLILSPIRPQTTTTTTTTLENTSPPKPYQSPFMARLFKLTQTSGSNEDPKNFITVRPKPSESTSSITSARDNDYNMNLLENKNKKRPFEPDSESIEVSDAIPQPPHLKKSRTLNLRKTKSVSNIPPPSSTSAPPKPVNNINKENEEEEEFEYPIPSWAKSPELYSHLKNQESMDPYSIFGPFPSLNLKDIFAHPELYLTEDDN
ncbi:hypothetical protein BD770DRAFT_440127 [Pilaira anomala]|nr:hypothetical protein BD770DRAFT_440127 [Pilaira anomala]